MNVRRFKSVAVPPGLCLLSFCLLTLCVTAPASASPLLPPPRPQPSSPPTEQQTAKPQPAVQPQPVVDSSVQASPVGPLPHPPAVDASAQASPAPPAHTRGRSIAAHTAIRIRLTQAIDSGRLKNGQIVHAVLRSSVRTSSGSLRAGTPVVLTVIATVPAGELNSYGEFSLQALRVGSVPVLTDVQSFRGKPGHKDLPDSAPAVGTDAGLARGATLTFHQQPLPVAASGPPAKSAKTPGSIDGVASGQRPPANAKRPATANNTINQQLNSSGKQNLNNSGNQKKPLDAHPIQPVQPTNNTPAPAQHRGQVSVAPNQPQKPSIPDTASPTQPR